MHERTRNASPPSPSDVGHTVTPGANEITVSLQDIVHFVLRGLVWAVLLGAGAGAAGYYLAQREQPVFRAEATLLVARTTGGFSQFGLSPVTAPPIDLSAYRAAASSDRVLAETARLLGFDDVQPDTIRSLRGATSTFVAGEGRDSSLLGVEARASTPEVAVARANAHATALVDWDRRRATESLTRVIGTLEQQIDALGEQIRTVQTTTEAGAVQTQVDGLIRLRADQQQQLAYARALIASAEGLLSVMQPADTSVRQVAPRPVMQAGVAALLAAVAAYALLLVTAALSTRLRSVDDIGAASGLPLLAQFPRAGARTAWKMQEATNYLRANLLFALHDVHPKVILVTSANEHEGKTTIAVQIAEAMVRSGYRTLLVDADLRSPTVAEQFDVVGTAVDVTTTRAWLDPARSERNYLKLSIDDGDQLFIVPQFVAASDAPEALGRGFAAALAEWHQFDVVVVDSAPVLAVADSLAIAPSCAGTILVVDSTRTPMAAITRSRELLDRVGANILGVVANNVRNPSSAGGYGGAYGAGYGARPATSVTATRGIARLHADRGDPRSAPARER